VGESWRNRLLRWRINHFPCYRGTGGRLVFVSEDRRTWRVEVPLNRRTRNIWGTIFGGSLYAAVDPVYGVMLADLLGPGVVVWIKTAQVRFRRPGRETLTAECHLTEAALSSVREEFSAEGSAERTFLIELKDSGGEVCTAVEATYHIASADVGRPGVL